MLATYGVDVLDPAVSLRRIHVLATRLPAGAFPQSDSPAAWSVEAHLLARLNDAVDQLTWLTARAHGGKGPRPKPLPRPGGKRAAPPRSGGGWKDFASQLMAAGGKEVRSSGG